jgi:hypothetical protein
MHYEPHNITTATLSPHHHHHRIITTIAGNKFTDAHKKMK